MTRHMRFVFGDQLTRNLSALRDIDPAQDIVVMIEAADEALNVPHHKQKIALVLSAMRHFAASLQAEGLRVDYVPMDATDNLQDLGRELAKAVQRHSPKAVIVTEPSEWRAMQLMRAWDLDAPLDVREDDRFFCTRANFAALTKAKKTGRMEYFYREMRRRTGLLMRGDGPEGGQWNFDTENRKALPKGLRPPPRARFAPDEITTEVLTLVATRFASHFGDLTPFGWAVTRDDALIALDHFITHCLPSFGTYQDAMKTGEDFLYHSLISPYLNLGLLNPREVCATAEAAYQSGQAPINAVEGFIRQILGWREFVRGIYWAEMPEYGISNHLNATRDLPALYWTGDTPMHCMAECISTTRRHAYAHHIQRLMITGNFALIAGLDPAEVNRWYLAVYADAFEWVELPNTQGMALYADGGVMASKPYAASAAYINRMGDYCRGCAHDAKDAVGPRACPFNFLYWDFIARHAEEFARNPRMAMPVMGLRKLKPEKLAAMRAKAREFLDGPEMRG